MIKIPNYTITKKIASGGMGDVYMGHHKVLGYKVAIKSLHANLVKDDNFRKRFITEAKTHYKLRHPNIVKLNTFHEEENGLYLIMEYVDGKQLNDYINKITGPIPEEKLNPIFIKVLKAIEYAHSKKLIHRDIKPANILITKDDEVKVIDFGIVKNEEEDYNLTKADQKVGTISYMSPEQVNGEKIDKRTDIYSLGITLYQMAVGRGPYEGETNAFKIQTKIVSDPLPDPKKIYPGISDKLLRIIEKATQKDKKKRFKNCKEFIDAFSKEVKPLKTKEKKKTTKISETKEIKGKNVDNKTTKGIKVNKGGKSAKPKNNNVIISGVFLFLGVLGIGFWSYLRSDQDGDGIANHLDICPNTPDGALIRVDADGCSNSQKDTDKDGVNNGIDICNETPTGEKVDADGCSSSQKDTDGDGVSDNLDNCNETPTGDKVDVNGCTIIDTPPESTDDDNDRDGVNDDSDRCPQTPNGERVDTNGCSASQKDTDRDGVKDNRDRCSRTPNGERVDANGCSSSQKDSDKDGVKDNRDRCPNTGSGINVDYFGCPDEEDTPTPQNITIRGTVKSGQNRITGAKITLWAKEKVVAETNWNGNFSFTIPLSDFSYHSNIESKKLAIEISKNGYKNKFVNLTDPSSGTIVENILLEQDISNTFTKVTGKVREGNKPAKRFTIIVSSYSTYALAKDDPNKRLHVFNDSNGSYTISLSNCDNCDYIYFINRKGDLCERKIIDKENISTSKCN